MKELKLENIENNILYIEDINNGLKNFNNAILTVKENDIDSNIEKFKNFILMEGKNIIVDYYGNKINEEAFKKMLKVLEKDEQDYLIDLRKTTKEIFFTNIEEKFLEIILKLSLEEILFSSFYIEDTITIWGNYNKRFVIFFKEKSTINKIEEAGLVVEDINYINNKF